MRDLANRKRILEFMSQFGRHARQPVDVYFTGGTTAVLFGWRDTTVDIDLRFEPEADELFRSIPEIKENLQINVELAAPSDFIPELPGWKERRQFIDRVGKVNYYHYDPYSQALSKIERGHGKDLDDVKEMLAQGLIDLKKLVALFEEIVPFLYKYPAIDPRNFAEAVHRFVKHSDKQAE